MSDEEVANLKNREAILKATEFKASERTKKLFDIEVPMKEAVDILLSIAKEDKSTEQRLEAIKGILTIEDMIVKAQINDKVAENIVKFAEKATESNSTLSKQLKKLEPKVPPWMGGDSVKDENEDEE